MSNYKICTCDCQCNRKEVAPIFKAGDRVCYTDEYISSHGPVYVMALTVVETDKYGVLTVGGRGHIHQDHLQKAV